MSRLFAIVFLIVVGMAPLDTNGAVATLPAKKDNTLYESMTGHLSNGAGEYLFAGSTIFNELRRGVIAFDIAGNIPAGSTINGVVLTLHMSRTRGGADIVALHRALADWGEGGSIAPGEGGSGGNTEPGDATWLHTFAFNQFWQNPGGDFDESPSAVSLVSGIGFYSWTSTPELVADVQAWLDDPGGNFGWGILGNESIEGTAKRFDTRENLDPAFRPVLTVNYTPVPEPGTAALLAVFGGLRAARRRR